MDLRHLRHFLVVANQLNITRAAKLLSLSQPALSRQVRDLETELKVGLFTREVNGLRLTGAGKFLVREAQSILDRSDLLVKTFSSFASQEQGRFTIGYDPGAISQKFFGTLSRFGAHHPKIEMSIREQSTAQLLAALRANTMDVAVIPITRKAVPLDCESLIISQEPLALIVSSGHALARSSGVRLSDMADEVLVSYREDIAPIWHDYVMDACGKAGFTPSNSIKTDTYSSMLAMIAAGEGYGLLPKILGTNLRLALTTVPLVSPVLTIDTCAVWRRTSTSQSLPLFLGVLATGRESAVGNA